ncbi:MAG: phosphohistidine phosphatase SixA, partial [Verrucomicrobiota bacterium]|nr:phosphohistidine phosphatase SixA [Verrucomicrobiota bacterium]
MITLYFLRHGQADWPGWDKPDDERPLTKKGKKEMRRVAKFLCKLKVAPSLILTSPLPRALQTAEIVAACFEVSLRVEPTLGKGFNVTKLKALLKSHPGQDVMLVGHDPDFTAVLRNLTGARVKLAKGGVARVCL